MITAQPVRNTVLFDELSNWVFQLPHCKILGLELVDSRTRDIVIRLPYQTHLIGNLSTGVIHGGAITTMIDTASGLAVFASLPEKETIATLDLRIDYLRPTTPNLPVYCKAECYRLSRQVAFTRATAYQDDQNDPVAHAVGTFMRSSSSAVINMSKNHDE